MYTSGPRILKNNHNHALDRINKRKQQATGDSWWLSSIHLRTVMNKVVWQGGKAPGPDGLTFPSLSMAQWNSKLRFLGYIIKNQAYQPGPTRPVEIPKFNGKKRIIQVPNFIDKVAARACMEALSDVCENMFVDWSYGYRPGRSHVHVLKNIQKDYQDGCVYIAHYDARDAFDNINVSKLKALIRELPVNDKVKSLAEGIVSKGVADDGLGKDFCDMCENTLALNGGYAVTSQAELVGKSFGNIDCITEYYEQHDISCKQLGISQGNSLSGLMYNLFLHNFHDKVINSYLNNGLRIYRYADNFICVGKEENAVNELASMSMGLLIRVGIQCRCDETVNINNKILELLGLTVIAEDNNITFDLTESSWTRLDQVLDEALTHPSPSKQTTLITNGWKQSSYPVTWSVRHQERLDDLLSKYGVNAPLPRNED